MNSFGILNNTCKNCGKNHLLYKKEYQCSTCEKKTCISCSHRPYYLMEEHKSSRECRACNQKNSKDIRKMIATESGIIREYNIVNESNSVIYSGYYLEPLAATEHLKYLSLTNGFNAVICLKSTKVKVARKNVLDLANRTSRGVGVDAYQASGILVEIKKQ